MGIKMHGRCHVLCYGVNSRSVNIKDGRSRIESDTVVDSLSSDIYLKGNRQVNECIGREFILIEKKGLIPLKAAFAPFVPIFGHCKYHCVIAGRPNFQCVFPRHLKNCIVFVTCTVSPVKPCLKGEIRGRQEAFLVGNLDKSRVAGKVEGFVLGVAVSFGQNADACHALRPAFKSDTPAYCAVGLYVADVGGKGTGADCVSSARGLPVHLVLVESARYGIHVFVGVGGNSGAVLDDGDLHSVTLRFRTVFLPVNNVLGKIVFARGFPV